MSTMKKFFSMTRLLWFLYDLPVSIKAKIWSGMWMRIWLCRVSPVYAKFKPEFGGAGCGEGVVMMVPRQWLTPRDPALSGHRTMECNLSNLLSIIPFNWFYTILQFHCRIFVVERRTRLTSADNWQIVDCSIYGGFVVSIENIKHHLPNKVVLTGYSQLFHPCISRQLSQAVKKWISSSCLSRYSLW